MKYKVTFLGSKGMIEESSPTHRKRTGIIIETPQTRFQVDCGEPEFFDKAVKTDFLVVSHCHPDHVVGLKSKEVPVPVVCSSLVRRQLIRIWKVKLTSYHNSPLKFKDILIQLVPCLHSIRCPMWGIIVNQELGIFTDVIRPRQGWKVLQGLRCYIGDGSAINHKIIRFNPKIASEPFGHTSMKDQLEQTKANGVQKVVFTHLGRQPVLRGDAQVRKILKTPELGLAQDNLTVVL